MEDQILLDFVFRVIGQKSEHRANDLLLALGWLDSVSVRLEEAWFVETASESLDKNSNIVPTTSRGVEVHETVVQRSSTLSFQPIIQTLRLGSFANSVDGKQERDFPPRLKFARVST